MSRLDRVREIIKIVAEEDTHGFCSVGSPWIIGPNNEIHCPVDDCEECIFNALVRLLNE